MSRLSPRGRIFLEFLGEALCRHLQFFVLGLLDIDDRPTRRTDDANAPRMKRDTVCSGVKTDGA